MKLNIGENIRTLRRQADMTQEQLAELLGVTYQSVSRWENGENYPDLELIPRLAAIFEVTADTLLAVPEVSGERYRELMNELMLMSMDPGRRSAEAYIRIFRELRLDFPLYRNNQFQMVEAQTIPKEPEILEELRPLCHLILKNTPHKAVRSRFIRIMSILEDDAHIDSFLEEYSTVSDMCRFTLLEKRYFSRQEWDRHETMRQARLHMTISDLCGVIGGESGIHWHPVPCQDTPTLPWENERKLSFLHSFNVCTPAPEHPISGDGTVDIWLPVRLELGFQRAALCMAAGDPAEARITLADTVSLLERAFSLPDGTVLTCSSPAMTGYTAAMRCLIGGPTPHTPQKSLNVQCPGRVWHISVLFWLDRRTQMLRYTLSEYLNPLREEDWFRDLGKRMLACYTGV